MGVFPVSFSLFFLPLGCSTPIPPAVPSCASAGWGSWGWDLMPVTNHIARDFQLTLCSALGTPVAKDACPGYRVMEEPSMTTGLRSRA